VIAACSEVLDTLNSCNIKALYRRAQARILPKQNGLTEYLLAMEDLKKALLYCQEEIYQKPMQKSDKDHDPRMFKEVSKNGGAADADGDSDGGYEEAVPLKRRDSKAEEKKKRENVTKKKNEKEKDQKNERENDSYYQVIYSTYQQLQKDIFLIKSFEKKHFKNLFQKIQDTSTDASSNQDEVVPEVSVVGTLPQTSSASSSLSHSGSSTAPDDSAALLHPILSYSLSQLEDFLVEISEKILQYQRNEENEEDIHQLKDKQRLIKQLISHRKEQQQQQQQQRQEEERRRSWLLTATKKGERVAKKGNNSLFGKVDFSNPTEQMIEEAKEKFGFDLKKKENQELLNEINKNMMKDEKEGDEEGVVREESDSEGTLTEEEEDDDEEEVEENNLSAERKDGTCLPASINDKNFQKKLKKSISLLYEKQSKDLTEIVLKDISSISTLQDMLITRYENYHYQRQLELQQQNERDPNQEQKEKRKKKTTRKKDLDDDERFAYEKGRILKIMNQEVLLKELEKEMIIDFMKAYESFDYEKKRKQTIDRQQAAEREGERERETAIPVDETKEEKSQWTETIVNVLQLYYHKPQDSSLFTLFKDGVLSVFQYCLSLSSSSQQQQEEIEKSSDGKGNGQKTGTLFGSKLKVVFLFLFFCLFFLFFCVFFV
jgi:hypothetical protein